jgi:hypothetical protein
VENNVGFYPFVTLLVSISCHGCNDMYAVFPRNGFSYHYGHMEKHCKDGVEALSETFKALRVLHGVAVIEDNMPIYKAAGCNM